MLTEKMMEDQIAERPEEFLGERELVLVSRQLRIGKYVFDLLFQDRFKGKLIVEIQKGTLDRVHTYKILDYYDEYREHHPHDFIELMVVANSVPLERKKRLHALGVEYREIPESRFLQSVSGDSAALASENSEPRPGPVLDEVPNTLQRTELHVASHAPFQSLGKSAFVLAAREAIDTWISDSGKPSTWKTGGQTSLTAAFLPATHWLRDNGGEGLTAQLWMERPKNGVGVCKFEIAGDKLKKSLRERTAALMRQHLQIDQIPGGVTLATGSTIARCSFALPEIRSVQDDSPANATLYAPEIAKIVSFIGFLEDRLADWLRSVRV